MGCLWYHLQYAKPRNVPSSAFFDSCPLAMVSATHFLGFVYFIHQVRYDGDSFTFILLYYVDFTYYGHTKANVIWSRKCHVWSTYLNGRKSIPESSS
jgi:hypothetical protein